MYVSSLSPTPEGLRAVYVVLTSGPDEEPVASIAERLVDAVALMELEAPDIRTSGEQERTGARRGRKTKLAGVIFEGELEPKVAPEAVEWFRRLYGDSYIAAKLIGYTRSEETLDMIMGAFQRDQQSGMEFPEGEETPTMRQTRIYWSKIAMKAKEELLRR